MIVCVSCQNTPRDLYLNYNTPPWLAVVAVTHRSAGWSPRPLLKRRCRLSSRTCRASSGARRASPSPGPRQSMRTRWARRRRSCRGAWASKKFYTKISNHAAFLMWLELQPVQGSCLKNAVSVIIRRLIIIRKYITSLLFSDHWLWSFPTTIFTLIIDDGYKNDIL